MMYEFNFILDCNQDTAREVWMVIENHCEYWDLELVGGYAPPQEEYSDVQETD